MKALLISLLGVTGLPLAGTAQKLAATHPPVYYRIGQLRAPLYRSGRDTVRPADLFLPSQSLASIVGEFSPRWAVAKREGFLYLTPTAALVNYDPADADPLPIDAATHRISYQGVVQVPGIGQAELYRRARAWVGQAYPQQNAEITRDAPDTGELHLQGTELVQLYQDFNGVPRGTYAGVVRHALAIYVKDGRYKYVLTDFVHDAQRTPNLRSGGPLEQKHASLFGYAGLGSMQPWEELKTDALRTARALVASLELAMTQQPPKAHPRPSDF